MTAARGARSVPARMPADLIAAARDALPPDLYQRAAYRIVRPFFTTKPLGVGTGLGLSICHSLITAVGGQIEVASKVGVGTRFLIILPSVAQEPAGAAVRPAA